MPETFKLRETSMPFQKTYQELLLFSLLNVLLLPLDRTLEKSGSPFGQYVVGMSCNDGRKVVDAYKSFVLL